MSLPPCGIYKTSASIGSVGAGHLVYFHNHGDPGPGIYLPESWRVNRAVFRKSGFTLSNEQDAETLEPLAAEGLYRVAEEFTCCEKRCVTYSPDMLVQLGYTLHAEPIVFRPVWAESGLAFPENGQKVEADRVARLARLAVAESGTPGPVEVLH